MLFLLLKRILFGGLLASSIFGVFTILFILPKISIKSVFNQPYLSYNKHMETQCKPSKSVISLEQELKICFQEQDKLADLMGVDKVVLFTQLQECELRAQRELE